MTVTLRKSVVLTTAVTCFLILAKAARLTRRSGVTCNKTYAGDLVLMNLAESRYNDIPKQTNAYLDSNNAIAASVSGAQASMRVQFDTCTADGWNVDGQQYGQVKPEGQDYSCFTVATNDTTALVHVLPCESENGGILEAQWFKGEWDDQGGFHVIASGNPNASPNVRPNVSFNFTADAPEPNEISVEKQYYNGLTEFQFSGIEYY